MKLGYHTGPGASQVLSSVINAKSEGLTALQTFSGGRINRKVSWPLKPEECRAQMQELYGLVHAAYVINICVDPKSELAILSRECLHSTLIWAQDCGFSGVVVHPGSAKESSPKLARTWASENLKRIFDEYNGDAPVLLENSAGDVRGRLVGQEIEELEEILDATKDVRVKLCVDTVHAWAAGYTFEQIKELSDNPNISAWHLNNPKIECDIGGHKDRHGTWIDGLWDESKFLELLLALAAKPMIMESRTGAEDLILAKKLLAGTGREQDLS
jgi:endonuclease IV